MRNSVVNSVIIVANLVAAPALLAAGDSFVPGANPHGGDMLTPDQVSTAGISSKPTNDSGVYIGVGGTVGQGRTTDSSSTPGVAFLGHVEPGYQVSTGSWSRLELGLDFFAGTVNYRLSDDNTVGGKVSYPGLYGVLAKAGYGYSLGDNMFGVFKVGVGPVFSKVQVETANAGTYKSDAVSGIAWELAWDAVAPITKSLDFIFGISWMQMDIDVSKLKHNGVSVTFDRSMIANIPAVDLGLRLRL